MNNQSDFYVILCSCPDIASAKALACHLVQNKLAGCINIMPSMNSIYEWEDTLVSTEEVLIIIKTHKDKFEALEGAIKARHPYDVPEIIALPITTGSQKYLSWLSLNIG